MFDKVSEGVKVLAKQMVDHPEDWKQCQYHYANIKANDVQIWTANGTSSLHYEGNECLNIKEQKFLADAIKLSIANRVVAAKA